MTQPGIRRLRTAPFLSWLALAALIWWSLTEGAAAGWLFGSLLVIVVAFCGSLLTPEFHHRVRLTRLPSFLVFFVWHSWLAGIDVARRTLHPSLPLAPGEQMMNLRLPEGAPRALLMCTLSLLPGTLAVNLQGNQLRVHVLDTTQNVVADMLRTEQAVARLFGLVLDAE